MSSKVLVIPEDPRNNGYILKPVMECVLAEAGRPNAQVTVLPRSRLGGISNAKDAIRNDRLATWKWMDLWIFTPDADRTNADALREMEKHMADQGVKLIGCAAVPEVEAWLLAGHRRKLAIQWPQVVAHSRLKEEVFDPFMAHYGHPNLPGMGREKLTRETLANYPALKQLCPEIAELEERLRQHFSQEV